jgi:hypothetical protein
VRAAFGYGVGVGTAEKAGVQQRPTRWHPRPGAARRVRLAWRLPVRLRSRARTSSSILFRCDSGEAKRSDRLTLAVEPSPYGSAHGAGCAGGPSGLEPMGSSLVERRPRRAFGTSSPEKSTRPTLHGSASVSQKRRMSITSTSRFSQ